MHFLIALVIWGFLILLFAFIGHTSKKIFKVAEENSLLKHLIEIAIGISSLLIIINLIGRVTSNFYLGLLTVLLIIGTLCIIRHKELIEFLKKLIEKLNELKNLSFIKEHSNKYFIVLLISVNIIYGLTAFTTTKLDHLGLGDKHIFNLNQLAAGTYPPKYSFLPNLDQRNSFGADILAAIVSKLSGLHPELSLDLLALIFLNLSILIFYALTKKFVDSNQINKYLVPFSAFLAWGPITSLFSKNPGETIPTKFLEKIIYLTQTRLIERAHWSGSVIHYFFAPTLGIGIFFFFIAIYLLFKYFEEEKDLKHTIFLGAFLSSLVIIDFSKFIVLISATVLYVIFSKKFDELLTRGKIAVLKLPAILFLSLAVFGFIHGNWLIINNNLESIGTFYKFGTLNISNNLCPLGSNTILLAIYAFGFYTAYKAKNNWVTFLIPYFVTSLILPYFISIPNAGIGRLFMASSLIGAFAIPFTVEFIHNKFDFIKQNSKFYYASVFLILCFSTLMFWAFGDKEKPLFKIESGKIRFSGFQTIPQIGNPEESELIKKLKTQDIRNKIIVTEPTWAELFTFNTGLFAQLPFNPTLIKSEYPISQKALSLTSVLRTSTYFDLDRDISIKEKVGWIYLTPGLFRTLMYPQSRKRLLDAYLNKGVTLIQSNGKEDLTSIKELFKIDPRTLPAKNSLENNKTLLKFSKYVNRHPKYIQEIIRSPFLGIYNAKSNDYDGDKIADVAFFDEFAKHWYIIYGKDNEEVDIDLTKSIFLNNKASGLFIPIPSDYDGDGKTDIALYEKGPGIYHIIRSSDSKQDSSMSGCYNFGEIALPSDLDGDSKCDIACINLFSGTWPALISSTGYHFQGRQISTSIIDIPAYSDIDGDKKADHVIYKSDKNQFNIYLSSENFNLGKFIQIPIGSKNSRVVLDDYDGDKKIDLATWTPDTGEWEIAYAKDLIGNNSLYTTGFTPPAFVGCGIPQNTNNNIQGSASCATHKFTLGKSTDIPMPGDYNGDGKAEIAVFHIKSGKLEIFFTGGNKKIIDFSKYIGLIPANFIGV